MAGFFFGGIMKQPINKLIIDNNKSDFFVDLSWPDENCSMWDETVTIATGKSRIAAMYAARRRIDRLKRDIDLMIDKEWGNK